MAGGLILETTFLVDLERELAAGSAGPAQAFLAQRSAEPLFLTSTIAGELAAGFGPDGKARWEKLVGPYPLLPVSSEVCWQYGQTYRYLRDNGLLIAANDLWIAATALAFDKGLVTRNFGDFRRVPGLTVVGY